MSTRARSLPSRNASFLVIIIIVIIMHDHYHYHYLVGEIEEVNLHHGIDGGVPPAIEHLSSSHHHHHHHHIIIIIIIIIFLIIIIITWPPSKRTKFSTILVLTTDLTTKAQTMPVMTRRRPRMQLPKAHFLQQVRLLLSRCSGSPGINRLRSVTN